MVRRLGQLLAALTWVLVAGSVVIIAGSMFGRPLLLAAVPTGSMVPALTPGDLIVLLPTWVMPAPGPGDIIVYRTPKDPDWVVHRIVEGTSVEGFVTKGDANPRPDAHRVLPWDMAGLVPQWGGTALRIQRLGILSMGTGPLSSPVVAGVALALGVYLLVADLKPSAGGRRLPGRRSARTRPEAILSLYLGLAGTAFLTTLIPAWSLSARQGLQYEVVPHFPANTRVAGRYVLGQPHREEVGVKNSSPLPLAILFVTEDPRVTYTPGRGLIPPYGERTFEVTVRTDEPGTFRSAVHMGVFLPLLPMALLAWLGEYSMALAALVLAMVPAVAVLGIGLLDGRARKAFERWRFQLEVRR